MLSRVNMATGVVPLSLNDVLHNYHVSKSSIHCKQGGLSRAPLCKTNIHAVMALHTHGAPLFPGQRFRLTQNCHETCALAHAQWMLAASELERKREREKKKTSQRECLISQIKIF